MIKCPVCRKLPGDLSVFLKQPQMVCSFRCNTSEQCYVEVSPCLALGRAGLPEVFFFFFKSSGCAGTFLLWYHLNNGSNMLIPLMILIKLSVIFLISYLIYLHLK